MVALFYAKLAIFFIQWPPNNPKNADRGAFIKKNAVPSVGTYELD